MQSFAEELKLELKADGTDSKLYTKRNTPYLLSNQKLCMSIINK
jgi:hypothetical protein